MRTRLLENPELQDSAGGFDRNRFARLLQLSNLSEQAYLARLGEDIKRQQPVVAVTEAAVAPASLAERLFGYPFGRATGRERVCQSGQMSEAAVSLRKNINKA